MKKLFFNQQKRRAQQFISDLLSIVLIKKTIFNKFGLSIKRTLITPFCSFNMADVILITKIDDNNKIKMQNQFSSPQHIRKSYGYNFQDGFPTSNNTSKGFPLDTTKTPSNQRKEQLANAIMNLEDKNMNTQNPNIKKYLSEEGSPILSHQSIISKGKDSKFKPVHQSGISEKGVESPGNQFLRGSCLNTLRKFQSSNNLGSSMRNTTRFNFIGKGGVNTTELKKSNEEFTALKTSHTEKNQPGISSVPGFIRDKSPLSRTPNKTQNDKKLDTSKNIGSKTPIKYKNVFSTQSNKTSVITKDSADTGDKKTFKSLNQIVANKAKQKMIQQTSISPQKWSKMINGFEMGVVLGKGKFGQVFLARHKEAGFMVAIKKIVKSKVVQFKMVNQFCNEIRLHSCLDHPNIVRFHGCFEQGEYIYLVMEYLNGGTLFDYLNQVNYLTLRETIQFLRDIIQALIYMHDKSIAHRDIKPENIVISSEGVAKLCDFGWSALVQTSRMTYCGTFDYAPPEILQRKQYDTSVDIWCIGILTYQLLTGKVPFQGDQKNQIMQKILNVDKTKIDYSVNLAPEARQFIEALVQKDPNLRPRVHELLKFKLFSLYPSKGNKNGISKK